MDNDNIAGRGGGFTRYVEKSEFDIHTKHNNEEHTRINNALWGSEGTNGVVGDIHDIKNNMGTLKWVVGVSIGIISPIVSAIAVALILKYIGV